MFAVWIIIGLIATLSAYVLFVPITLRLNIIIDKKVSAVSAVRAFPFERKFVSGKPERKAKKSKPKNQETKEKLAEEPEEKAEKKFKLSHLSRKDILTVIDLIGEAFRFIGHIVKAPHYYLRAEIAGGATTPDVTGELYGAYQAIKPVLPGSISIIFNPDFNAERFSGTVEAGFVIRIFRLLWETLILILRLPIIKLIKLYRKLRK
jgi:hypothetical protein